MESRFQPNRVLSAIFCLCSCYQLCCILCYSKCSHGRHLHDHDRISSLPDELLLIILSFLAVNEMVKTSVLSSRWLNLWMNTPVLDFQLPLSCNSDVFGVVDEMECKNYVEWVNLVLRRHKCHYLKKFKTVFYLNLAYQKDIDSWLEFALARKVEILELNFLYSGCFPGSTFNYAFPDRYLQLDLTCLKSLALKNVDVAGEAINFILLNCPSLERLELVNNYKLVNLVISDPTLVLKYLQIKHCLKLKVLRISNVKLVSLDTSVGDLILRDLPMLVELSLVGIENNLSQLFSQVASYLPQLEALALHAMQLKELTQLSNLAQLTKLKRLVIDVGAYGDESLTMLLSFMKSCPNLKEFVLALTWYDPKRYSRIMCGVERFGSSSLSSLKVFVFKGYFGRACDFEMIIHVVKNAPDLEIIVIETRDLVLRKHNLPVDINEQQARSIALKQIGALRESEYIPPHVDVVIC